jgi:oxygen-dependent protoporphyrinogen oxidase
LRVVVVGGGLAGLFNAFELVERGVDDVMVLEQTGIPGGVTRTIRRDGFLLEPAAASFRLPHPHLSRLLERSGAETRPAGDVSVRYVHVNGQLVALSASPKAFLAPVLGLSAKLRALMEPLLPGSSTADESLADFAIRRFGKGAGELVSSLMATGVFAGDPRRLSVGSAFPALAEMERATGSVIKSAMRNRRTRSSGRGGAQTHVPVGGMDELADVFVDRLGDRFLPGFEVGSLRREDGQWIIEGPARMSADVVVLATPPWAAAGLFDGDLADALRQNVAAPVGVVFLGGSGPSPLPRGYGALIGPGEGLSTRGALFESSYAPVRAPEGSWLAKVIVGGAIAPSAIDSDDERLVSTVVNEVEKILDIDISPDFTEIVRHRPGIPQYEVGHRRWLSHIDRLAGAMPRLQLTGWGYRGVAVTSLATDSVRVADAITRS